MSELDIAIGIESDNEQILELIKECEEEIKFGKTLPDDHPVKKGFDTLFGWMKERGAEFSKIKLRY